MVSSEIFGGVTKHVCCEMLDRFKFASGSVPGCAK